MSFGIPGVIEIPDPLEEARKLARAAEEAARQFAEAQARALQEAARLAEEAAANAAREADILRQNAQREAEIAAKNTGKALEKAGQDIGRSLGQASNDTVAQLGRSYDDVVKLAAASYHFIENNVEGINKSIASAADRIEEGKLVDAVWGSMIDPLKVQEQAMADAVMESSVLNTIASSAAAIYGGPAGAAAYAAWYTYKVTGSLDAALKAGAIAWATSTAGQEARTIDGTAFDSQVKRVLASASIGGAAVAAAGGTDEQVLAAFGRGAVVGAAREGYAEVTKRPLDGSPATKPAVLKETIAIRDAYKTLDNGNLDITSMPTDISHVGISTDVSNPEYFSPLETSGLMQDLAKIPYVNSMAYFHDQWMAITNLQGIAVQVTILPAIALTGFGTEGTQNNTGTQQVIDETQKK